MGGTEHPFVAIRPVSPVLNQIHFAFLFLQRGQHPLHCRAHDRCRYCPHRLHLTIGTRSSSSRHTAHSQCGIAFESVGPFVVF